MRYDIINCQSAITKALKASLKLTNTNNSASLGPTVNIIDKYDARAVYYAYFVWIVYRQPQECDNIMFIYVNYTCRKVTYSFGKEINSKEMFHQKAMWLVCLRKKIYFQLLNWMGPDLYQEWGKGSQNIETRILLLLVLSFSLSFI